MNAKAKVAFCCYLVAVLLTAVFGVVYITRSEFMPYHAVAIGESWSQLSPEMQVLNLGFMKVAGGGFLATALACGLILFIPFRRNERWANWAILLTGLMSGLPTVYAASSVARSTPASPPWIAASIGVVLILVGFGFGTWGSRGQQ